MTSPSSRRPPRRRSRLADEHPAWPAAVPAPDDAPQEPSASAPVEAPTEEAQRVEQPPELPSLPKAPVERPDVPMPAPRRRRQTREQLNTRVTTDLHERLHRFVVEHDAAVQDVVETALIEYLERRKH